MANSANRAPVDMTPVANSDKIASLLLSYNTDCAAIKTLTGEVNTRKGQLLPNLVKMLEGVAPVSEPAWKADWETPARAAYVAAGRGTEKSAITATSAEKVAVIGITNGIKTVADETLKTYVDRARRILKDRKIIEGTNKASTPRHATDKAAKSGAPMSELNMFAQIAKGDENMVDALAWAAGDGKRAFLAFYAMQMQLAAA